MSQLSQFVRTLVDTPASYSSLRVLWKEKSLASQYRHYNESTTINQDQKRVTSKRLALEKFSPPKAVYFQFLKCLYPIKDQKHIHYESLFKTYLKLPIPRPNFINPNHLEKLLESFKENGGEKRGTLSSFVEHVHTDLKYCNIDLSISERNNQFYIENYNQTNVEFIISRYQSLIPKLDKLKKNKRHISTMNIFLKFAVKFNNSRFITEILDDIEKFNLKYDRITYTTLLDHLMRNSDSEALYKLLMNYIKEENVIDIYVMNILINCLIQQNEIQQVEYIINKLVKNSPIEENKHNQQNQRIDVNLKRRQEKEVSFFLDSLKIQKSTNLLYNLQPTYETFSPLLKHFIKLQSFNPQKIILLLEFLQSQEIRIPTSLFKNLFKVFQHHEIENYEIYLPKILSILKSQETNINKSGEIITKYDDSLFQSIVGSFQKQSKFQLKNPNDLYIKWTKLGNESHKQNWKHVDMKAINQDIIGHLMKEY